MSVHARRVLALLLLLCATLPASALAQTETGTITGTVTDQSNAVLPGVAVTLTSRALIGGSRTTTTTGTGAYKFIALPPGSYDLKYELAGFKPMAREAIRISANFIATVNISMGVEALSETVSVIGESPVVDSKSALVATTLDKGLLDNIPTGRDIWVLTEEVAGTVPDRYNVGGTESAQQSTFAIHGATAQQDYAINGLSMNWPGGAGNYTMFYFDYDSFDEVQVETAGAPAEVSVGGLYMNMITKSGSADFHGGTTLMYEPGKLQGNNVTDELKAQGITTANPIEHIVDFEPTLGGPISKHAWFFGSYRMYVIDNQILGLPAGENVDINHQANVLGKVTAQVTPQNNLMVQYYFNGQNRFFRRDNGYAFTTQDASWRQIEPAHLIQGQWTSVLSKALFLDVRFGYLHQIFPLGPQTTAAGISKIDDILSTVSGSAPNYQTNLATRQQTNTALTYFNDHLAGGTHAFKFGFELARALNAYDYSANGDVNAHFLDGVASYVQTYNTPMHQESNIQNLAVYAQDAYSIRRLTLNVGARFENFKGWNPAQGAAGGAFSGSRQFSQVDDIPNISMLMPRIGASYDVFGNGRTAVKASFSRYALEEGSRFPETLNPNALSGDFRNWSDGNKDGVPQANELTAPTSFFGGASGITLDSNISRQYSDEITAGIQHQLGRDLGLTATYYHRRNSNLFAQLNQAIPASAYSAVQEPLPSGGAVTAYNLAPQFVGQVQRVITNESSFWEKYNGLELTLKKRMADRWQMMMGYTYSSATSNYVEAPFSFIDANDPNNTLFINGRVTGYDTPNIFKLSGTYVLPGNVGVSANYRYYTGKPLTPTLTASLNQGFVSVPTELRGDTRYPSVSLLDFRIGKTFKIGSKTNLEAMLNVYNVFNAATTISQVTTVGAAFGTPQQIMTPVIVGFGAHLTF
jgi:hypothetical protein